ncbi:MAG: hypothetical protein INR73_13255 [Williamsia sp.]|nr:hypothetical protein [Williamsia sp.]
MAFNSHEAVSEKRTALELTPEDSLYFTGDPRFDFEINFIPSYKIYFGYVLRIACKNGNIDLIYDQGNSVFRVITGQQFSGISFSIHQDKLFHEWSRVSLQIKPGKQTLEVSLDGRRQGVAKLPFPVSDQYYKVWWGANDDPHYQTRDIPPMRIREISLYNGNALQHHWSLNEMAGNSTLDDVHQNKATVKNPVWVRPKHQNWRLISSYVIKGNAVTAYDPKEERVFVTGSDSVFVYNTQNNQHPWTKLSVERENIMPGIQGVYDTLAGNLYDIFIRQKTVATYQVGQAHWTAPVDPVLTEYWHANKFISPLDTSLYIVGGYGQLKYKNTVQRYHFSTREWQILAPGGDRLTPRYLSALGLNERGDTAYVMGGYGSGTGDQMLNPGIYSDLFAYSIKSATFKKLFNLNAHTFPYTFANSLVIDSKNQRYYGLIFPNNTFHSKLQLIRGSLKDPSFQLLGDAIPYLFYDVQSYADLYYAPKAGKLIAVTLFYSDPDSWKGSTTVNVYSLDFPPALLEPVSKGEVPDKRRWPFLVGALAAGLLLATVVLLVRRRKHRQVDALPSSVHGMGRQAVMPVPPSETGMPEQIAPEIDSRQVSLDVQTGEEELPLQSRILLFNQFKVLDQEGNDLTVLFTPLIKEMFLLILIYTFRNKQGITSNELNEILWNGKSVKDAKNNRSVNMTKLKNILEKVGNCAIVKKDNFWRFETAGDRMYVDYERLVALFLKKRPIDMPYMEELLALTGKGSFLLQTAYDWLDDIKSEISDAVINVCLDYLRHHPTAHDEFNIEIANCIFRFDALNEDALKIKCRSFIHQGRYASANSTYAKFIREYREIYGEEYSKSFNEFIKDTSGYSSQ